MERSKPKWFEGNINVHWYENSDKNSLSYSIVFFSPFQIQILKGIERKLIYAWSGCYRFKRKLDQISSLTK